jgi:hypothetical protein
MVRVSSVALLAGAAFLSLTTPASAQESPPPAPPTDAPPATPPPATPPSTPPPASAPANAGAAPMSDAEQQKLLEELQAEDKKAGKTPLPSPTAGLPDLSKVNLAAGIPGAASMNPDMSIILDVAGAAFGVARSSAPGSPLPDTPLLTGGHDPNGNGFTLRQVELSFSGAVDPYFRFDSNIVLKDSIEVEEAYVTTLDLPLSLQMRFGEFLSKFGRLNEQHPHSWWFITQPLVYGQMMGEDNFRGLGAELSWLSPLPWATTFILEVQDAQGACCARTFSPFEDKPAIVNNPTDLLYTGVIEQFFPITDDLSLLWGLSATAGPAQYLNAANATSIFTGEGRAELLGTDVLLRYKPLTASSRWFIDFQAEGIARLRHPGSLVQTFADEGAYAQIVFHPNPEIGGGVRYDWVSPDPFPGDPANAGLGPNTQRGAVVLEYAPDHFARIQLEGNLGTRGQGDLLWGAMINLEVAVGAHGAHAY